MNHHKGIHHITAVAGDPQQNLNFYAGKLGLRLVKKTVNFDDPSVYHLYYGDETGTPGTILTFFPWSYLAPGKPGSGQVIAIGFSVPEASFNFWMDYLKGKEIDFIKPFERFGKQVIGLQDPDGLHLELIADPKVHDIKGWSGGPVPAEYAIRGFHGATFAEQDYKPAERLLEEDLGFKKTDERAGRHLFQTEATLGSAIEIIDQSELYGKPGKGTVHHIAFRANDEEEQMSVRKELLDKGYYITAQKDRQYFKSVYFREAGGVLCEVATEGPGFTIDEDIDILGMELKLPRWLEDRRDLIEADLPVLKY